MYRNVHLGGKAGDTDACGPVAERMRDILCLRAASMTPCVSSLCQSAVNDCTHKTAHTLYGHSEKPRERSPEMAASLLCRILLYGRCAAGTDVSVHSRGGQQRRVRPWHPRGQPRLPTGCVCRRTGSHAARRLVHPGCAGDTSKCAARAPKATWKLNACVMHACTPFWPPPIGPPTGCDTACCRWHSSDSGVHPVCQPALRARDAPTRLCKSGYLWQAQYHCCCSNDGGLHSFHQHADSARAPLQMFCRESACRCCHISCTQALLA